MDISGNSNLFIDITDILGKIIKQEGISSSTLSKEYNLSNYESGIYFVTLKTKNHQSVARIIKQ